MEMDSYLEILSGQIRNSRARKMAVREIRNHIEDQMAVYESQGMTKEEAGKEAVRQMGDPVKAGEELDRIHRPQMDWKLFWWIAAFSVLGLILQYICFYSLEDMAGSSTCYFIRQCICTAAGLAVMAGVCLCDYSILGKHPDLLGACFLGGIMVSCMSGVLPRYNGAYPYLKYMIYLFVPLYGGILWGNRGKGFAGLGAGVLWMGVVFITGTRCIGGGFSITANAVFTCAVMFLTAVWKDWFGVSRKAGLTAAGILAAAAGILLLTNLKPYQTARLQVLFHPENYETTAGYYMEKIRRIVSGLSLNRNTYGILEQKGLLEFWKNCQIPDGYMLLQSAVILGMAKTWILCAGYGAFFLYLFRMAIQEKNSLGQMTGMGCAMVLAAETIQNVMYNFGFGLSSSGGIPFLSYGRIHTVVVYVILGILLSIYRYRKLVWDTEVPDNGKRDRKHGLRIGDYVIRAEKRGC